MPATAQDRDVRRLRHRGCPRPRDPQARRSSQTVRWRNTTGVATSEIWFHLYLNAFASSESTFCERARSRLPRCVREASRMVGMDADDPAGPGRRHRSPAELTFERPDDGNEDDFTVARVELPREVSPGESVTFELEFEARLPRVVARTGFAGDFHMVGPVVPQGRRSSRARRAGTATSSTSRASSSPISAPTGFA